MNYQTIMAFAEIKFFKQMVIADSLERLSELQSMYENVFKNANYDIKQNVFMMDNPDSGDRVVIQPERIVISIKSISNLEKCIIFIKEIYEKICGIIDLKDYLRIGIRFTVGREYDKLEKIDSIIKEKFFKETINTFGNEIFNIGMKCSFDKGNYKINLGINPMVEKEITIEAITGKPIGEEEKINLAIDLDFYTGYEVQPKEYTNDDVISLFESVMSEQAKMLEGIESIIGEENGCNSL